MSAVPHPTTEAFAFSSLKIKGGEISVGLNLGVSQLHVLHATRSVWRNLYEHLAREFVAGSDLLGKPKSTRGHKLSPEKRATYLAAYVDHRTGVYHKRSDAARAHGLSYYAWLAWLSCNEPACQAAFAAAQGAKAPILKPSGTIL